MAGPVSLSTPDPWPGTPGGAYSPYWGGDIRLYVWAAILTGTTFKWGPSASDKLDFGYVWGKDTVARGPTDPPNRLWVDLSCDVQNLETSLGGSRADGAIAHAEAGTTTVRLADPNRIYDPNNPDSPFQYQGVTRLAPGTPLIVFAECWDGSAITQFRMFTGTVDSWNEPWELHPDKRVAVVQASDGIKDLVRRDYGATASVGTGDTVDARIARILTYYGWTGPSVLATSTNTLQATTMAQSAWELIGRATGDEIGFTYLDYDGTLRFKNRDTWTTAPEPVLIVGCSPDESASYDAMTEAQGLAASLNIANAVYASVTGGTVQVAKNQTSIDRYGILSYKRTDLGLENDSQAGAWASFLVSLQSWPRAHLDSVTLLPAFVPALWPKVLALKLITDRIKVLWTPPDASFTTEVTGRCLRVSHTVSRQRWEVGIGLVLADIVTSVMHWGAHPKDKLTAGNVYR
jgi:hypothetical protein